MRGWLVGSAAFWAAASGWADDFSAWTDSTQVRLNTTASGADVAVDQANFPVLVRLNGSDIDFSKAKSDGADLRFADAANNPLAFQVERFDPANKLAEIWVRVPTVKGNDSAQGFKLFYGNASAPPASNGAAVFRGEDGVAGAWHLGEDGNSSAGGYRDATSNANHGTGQGGLGANSDVAGAVGMAAHFVATSAQGIHIPHAASLHPTAGLTVEAWVKSNTQAPFKRFVGKPFNAVAAPWNEYSLEANIDGNKVAFSLTLDNAELGVIGSTVMNNFAWYHLVGTWDGANQKVYVNGVLEASLARTGAVSDYGQPLSIGKYALDGNSNFDGAVDEARVTRSARSAEWIKLSYANQKAGQTLVSFRPFTAQPPCQSQFAMPADTTVDEGANLILAARVACATGYSWTAVSGPAPVIFDPGVEVLQASMPRVAGDTAIVYRFTATYSDAPRSGQVRVRIREAIPDPEFTLPAPPTWNGTTSLQLKPAISNAAIIAASLAPSIRYLWSLSGVAADTTLGADFLTLVQGSQQGTLKVGLCLDNGGAQSCKEASISIGGTTGIRRPSIPAPFAPADQPGRDAKGRWFPRRLPAP